MKAMISCGCDVNETKVYSENTRSVLYFSSLPELITLTPILTSERYQTNCWLKSGSGNPQFFPPPSHVLPSHFSGFQASSFHTEWNLHEATLSAFLEGWPSAGKSDSKHSVILRKASELICIQSLLKALLCLSSLLVSLRLASPNSYTVTVEIFSALVCL